MCIHPASHPSFLVAVAPDAADVVGVVVILAHFLFDFPCCTRQMTSGSIMVTFFRMQRRTV
jgi:uncharacterized membrane protein